MNRAEPCHIVYVLSLHGLGDTHKTKQKSKTDRWLALRVSHLSLHYAAFGEVSNNLRGHFRTNKAAMCAGVCVLCVV